MVSCTFIKGLKMKHILLTTDFSKNSRSAMQYALELYAHFACKFHVLHVVKSSLFISDDLMHSKPTESIYSELIADAKIELEAFMESLKDGHENPLHSFNIIVDYDNLVAAINQNIEKHQIELIVTGTKGATNFGKVIFGSNTLRIFQRCNVSVLAIPEDCKFKPIKNALFTTKYKSTYNKTDLQSLMDLAEHYKFNLDVLHISERDKMDANQQQVQQDLELFFKNLNHQFVFKSQKPFLNTVLQYIEQHHIDLFCMMRKQHTFLEHLFLDHKTEQVAYHVKVPFLMLAYTN